MINTVEVQDDSNFENHYAHTQSIIFGQSLLLSFAFSYWKKQPSAELFLSFSSPLFFQDSHQQPPNFCHRKKDHTSLFAVNVFIS